MASDGLQQGRRGKDGSGQVLLLVPSRGLGGGIERYAETLQWVFAQQGFACQRLDLSRPGVRGHVAMLTDGRRLLRRKYRAHTSGRLSPGHCSSCHSPCT